MACIGGVCSDACAPDGYAKCQADCGNVNGPVSCFAGPESAFCFTGSAGIGDTPCQHDADCAFYDDPTNGDTGRCVAHFYGADVTVFDGTDAGTCVKIDASICPSAS